MGTSGTEYIFGGIIVSYFDDLLLDRIIGETKKRKLYN